jgi:hypothetical protein
MSRIVVVLAPFQALTRPPFSAKYSVVSPGRVAIASG